MDIDPVIGLVPDIVDPAEPDWLRGLSLDTDRNMPAILEHLIRISAAKAAKFGILASTPVVVGTVDHLMGVASP